jgi:hypothetical protein
MQQQPPWGGCVWLCLHRDSTPPIYICVHTWMYWFVGMYPGACSQMAFKSSRWSAWRRDRTHKRHNRHLPLCGYEWSRILMKRRTQSIIHVLTAISPVNCVLVQLMCRLIARGHSSGCRHTCRINCDLHCGVRRAAFAREIMSRLLSAYGARTHTFF